MGAQRSTNQASFADDVEAVQAASRVLVGVAAQSLADIEDAVSVPQLRAMMILSTRGPMHLTALAEAMGVHPSNATRACDRLVAAGLLDRRDNPADRRHLLLQLTTAGHALIDGVIDRRRVAIEKILSRMPTEHRRQLGQSLNQFAAAGGEPTSQDLLVLGWIS
jgi:DNA-binding MarR family transcriptional regulator